MIYSNSNSVGNIIGYIVVPLLMIAAISILTLYIVRIVRFGNVCSNIEDTLPNFEIGVTTGSEVVKGMPKEAIVYKSSKDRIVYRVRIIKASSGDVRHTSAKKLENVTPLVYREDVYYVFKFENGILVEMDKEINNLND